MSPQDLATAAPHLTGPLHPGAVTVTVRYRCGHEAPATFPAAMAPHLVAEAVEHAAAGFCNRCASDAVRGRLETAREAIEARSWTLVVCGGYSAGAS